MDLGIPVMCSLDCSYFNNFVNLEEKEKKKKMNVYGFIFKKYECRRHCYCSPFNFIYIMIKTLPKNRQSTNSYFLQRILPVVKIFFKVHRYLRKKERKKRTKQKTKVTSGLCKMGKNTGTTTQI